MDQIIEKKTLKIVGMTCTSCQNKIERKLCDTTGVQSVNVSYANGTADIVYDAGIISIQDITAVVKKLGYEVASSKEKQEANIGRVIVILTIVVSLYALLEYFGILNLLVPSQLANSKMSYGMLFIIGLITSIHCIAMCGGINLSQCIPRADISETKKQGRMSTFVPAFLYNLGRVISYTLIGFILGFAGRLFGGGGSSAGLPVMAQGILKLIAGLFMVIMGINMLGIFPWLRKLQPQIPKSLARKANTEKSQSKSPLIVGLLNGFMPCGPLQSMQIVALASGNPFIGALSMLLFSLGTVPLMLGLGSLVLALGKKFTHKVMNIGAVLVVVLGLAMLSQGGSLSGLLPPTLLLRVILALSAVGIVSSIPFRGPFHKAVSTTAALVLAVAVLVALNLGGTERTPAASGNVAVDAEQADDEPADDKQADGKQIINSTLSSYSYPNITVQAGTPVKWVINAPQGSINGCNNRINILEYNITNYAFKAGENIIEFTPTKTGRFQYTCWMGMISGTITVVEADATSPATGENSSQRDDYVENDFAGGDIINPAPVPAGYVIPTDSVALMRKTVDEDGEDMQEVTIELTDTGFSPAVVVVQEGLRVKWNIINTYLGEGVQLSIPAYYAQFPLIKGENTLYVFPDNSFDFSTSDNNFYGYIKVVRNVENADVAAIKDEVSKFETLIWPSGTFQYSGSSGGSSCH